MKLTKSVFIVKYAFEVLQQYLPFTVLKLKITINIQRNASKWLQQYLPFTVLKLQQIVFNRLFRSIWLQQYLPFTVLKLMANSLPDGLPVATVPTVYGIETVELIEEVCWAFCVLQQYLPFTVLKQSPKLQPVREKIEGCNSTYRLRY